MQSRESQYEKIFALWEEGAYDTPFYRAHLERHGLSGIEVDSPDKFKSLPFMTKADIRASTPEQRMRCGREEVLAYFASSGTTGAKKFYAFSREDKKVQEYVTKRVYTPLGIGPGDIGLVDVPVGSGNMGHSMCWQYMVMGGGFYCVDRPEKDQLRFALQNLPVTVLSTLPSLAMEMNTTKEDRRIAARSSIRILLVGGDVLTQSRREQLERLYHAKCYNSMGMSEIFGPSGNECPAQDGMHFCDDVLLMEVIDPLTHEEVPDGQTGLACYTSLWHKGSPLIRYLTDDLVCISHEPCSCGSDLPRMWHKGRLDFTHRNAQGRIISPLDLEDVLYAFGYGQPYHIGVKKDGSYTLHLVRRQLMERVSGGTDTAFSGNLSGETPEMMPAGSSGLEPDIEGACARIEQVLGGKTRIVCDLENDFEYKNHCFREE